MPKQRKQLKSQSPKPLKEFLQGYDSASIAAVMESLHNSLAWDMFAAYLRLRQREFEVVALDLQKNNDQWRAAIHASGYAQGMEDVSERLIPEFIRFVAGHTGVVEEARPEEN